MEWIPIIIISMLNVTFFGGLVLWVRIDRLKSEIIELSRRIADR